MVVSDDAAAGAAAAGTAPAAVAAGAAAAVAAAGAPSVFTWAARPPHRLLLPAPRFTDGGTSTGSHRCFRPPPQVPVAALLRRLRDSALAHAESDSALAHAESDPAVPAIVGGRNATFEAMTQGMQTVLSGTAASPPGGAADGAVARVRFHSMDILISRARCTMVCRHWHGALAVEKGKLGTTVTSWEPRTSSYVTALVLRKPWDGPRFIWDDKLQQGEVLLPDGSVPLRRSARGTTLDDPRLPIGTRDHPAGLCVTRASKCRSEHVPCECVTRSVTRALDQPGVEPTGGSYEEAVVVLGWRGWDEAAREARRETIATICFSPIHSLPGEELARLLRYAPEVVKQALQWHNSRAVQECVYCVMPLRL